jgi:methyltransferase (TIGR00027 family)
MNWRLSLAPGYPGSMQQGEPSRTALAAAAHRAAHQILEGGRIFSDPLAVRILGRDAESIAREAEAEPSRRGMRLFIAVRTRFAEDALETAVEGGVRQLVVLGAGLDTYAYRSPFCDRLRIFEVDHPATQAWKQQRLEDAAIPLPRALIFASVDFERQTLEEGILAAGFDRHLPAFFTWLGVVPYLTATAMWDTLEFVASLPGGTQVVFDYANPPESLAPEMRLEHDRRAARVAGLGEPWKNYWQSRDLHVGLSSRGFTEIEDLGPAEIRTRYFPHRSGPVPANGGHVLLAGTPIRT